MAIKGFTPSTGAADTKEMNEATIRALLEERRGYVQQGNAERVAEVDAELARLGHRAETKQQRSVRRQPRTAAQDATTRGGDANK